MPKSFNQHSGLTTEERFWDKVNKTESCWLWMGAHKRGYGHFTAEKRAIRATHYSYRLAKGEIPEGMVVCHNCPSGDNPKCVNPTHLFVGTQAENLKDMYCKGRSRGQKQTHCKHGHELTEDNVYIKPGNLSRQCRKCRAARVIQSRAKC